MATVFVHCFSATRGTQAGKWGFCATFAIRESRQSRHRPGNRRHRAVASGCGGAAHARCRFRRLRRNDHHHATDRVKKATPIGKDTDSRSFLCGRIIDPEPAADAPGGRVDNSSRRFFPRRRPCIRPEKTHHELLPFESRRPWPCHEHDPRLSLAPSCICRDLRGPRRPRLLRGPSPEVSDTAGRASENTRRVRLDIARALPGLSRSLFSRRFQSSSFHFVSLSPSFTLALHAAFPKAGTLQSNGTLASMSSTMASRS